jgi:hypothetical protein
MRDWADKVAFMRQNVLTRAKWSDGGDLIECELGPLPAPVSEEPEPVEPDKPHRPLANTYPGLRRNSQFVKVNTDNE